MSRKARICLGPWSVATWMNPSQSASTAASRNLGRSLTISTRATLHQGHSGVTDPDPGVQHRRGEADLRTAELTITA